MMKKQTAQKGDSGSLEIASGYATKASPGPIDSTQHVLGRYIIHEQIWQTILTANEVAHLVRFLWCPVIAIVFNNWARAVFDSD